jgi:hypothetical protein
MAIFGLDAQNPGTTYKKNTNANGGKAYFIQNIGERVNGVNRLQWVLDDAVPVWDVKFTTVTPAPPQPSTYPFSYLHQVLNNVDYYFFANSTDHAIAAQVRLRGKITPQIMDPHTGAITNAQFQNVTESGQDVTVVSLNVGAVKSVFIRNATPAVVGFHGAPVASLTKGTMDVVLRTSRSSSIHLGAIPLVKAGENARIEIFGMDGRLIGASERAAGVPGSRAIVFNLNETAERMTFGMYVCRIKATGVEKVMNFTIVK